MRPIKISLFNDRLSHIVILSLVILFCATSGVVAFSDHTIDKEGELAYIILENDTKAVWKSLHDLGINIVGGTSVSGIPAVVSYLNESETNILTNSGYTLDLLQNNILRKKEVLLFQPPLPIQQHFK